jgi:uncharacterized membrane protein HdeD (DUF308 family)
MNLDVPCSKTTAMKKLFVVLGVLAFITGLMVLLRSVENQERELWGMGSLLTGIPVLSLIVALLISPKQQ